MPAAVAATVRYEPLAVLHGVPFVHAQLDRLDGRGRQADVRRPRFVFRDAVVRDDELVALEVAGFDIRKLVNCLEVRSPHPHLPGSRSGT